MKILKFSEKVYNKSYFVGFQTELKLLHIVFFFIYPRNLIQIFKLDNEINEPRNLTKLN